MLLVPDILYSKGFFSFLLINVLPFSLTIEMVGKVVNQNVPLCIQMKLLEKINKIEIFTKP